MGNIIKNLPGECIKFAVNINKTVFTVITKRDSRGKLSKHIKKGWSESVNSSLWENQRLPCVWSFKHAIPRSDDVFIKGYCAECKANFKGTYNYDTENLDVKISGMKNITHLKKRRVQFQQKNEISQMLKGSSAYQARSEIANKLMTEHDFEPPQLPSLNALRKIKSKQDQSLNKDPRISLQIMKRHTYRDQIHHIGFDPFFVFYWTKLQKEWFCNEFKKKKCCISIDATGLGLKKVDTVEPKYTFLYVICAQGKLLKLDNI